MSASSTQRSPQPGKRCTSARTLKPESWSQFYAGRPQERQTHPYGFASKIRQESGQTIHGHDGSFQGFEAILTRYIEEELTIIALANLKSKLIWRQLPNFTKLIRQTVTACAPTSV